MQTQRSAAPPVYQISSTYSKSGSGSQQINNNNGCLTQRLQRQEWNKPTSINQQKPLNQHRSIDNRMVPTAKKSDYLENSGTKSLGNTQNFLFNTYSATGTHNLKNSSSQDKSTTRHLSIKGWINPSNSQQNQQSQILKNLLLSNHSQQTSQNKTLESSNSSTNLMLDSGIMTVLNIQNTLSQSQQKERESQNESKVKVFNDLQNQLESFTASRQPHISKSNDISHVISSFAPPQTAKAGIKNLSNMKFPSELASNEKQENPFNIENSQPHKIHTYISQYSNGENKLDYSIDTELEAQTDDINESVVHFKQSTSQAKSQDPTPKSQSLLSYKKSIQSSEKINHKEELTMDINGLNQVANNKDSRNQLASYLSQQLAIEASQGQSSLFNTKVLNLGQTAASSGVSSKNSEQSSAQRKGHNKNNSDSSKKIKAKVTQKGKAKVQAQNSNLTIGQKNASEVFQYKLKTTNTTTAFLNQAANLRLDGLLKSSTTTNHQFQSQPSSFRQNTVNNAKQKYNHKYSAKVAANNTNGSISSKPPSGQNTKIEGDKLQQVALVKCESQKEMFYTSSKQELNLHLVEEIDNVNIKFLYATTDDKGNPPPNSLKTSSPNTEIRKHASKIQPNNLEDNKVKVLDFDLDNPNIDSKQSIRVISRFRPFNNLENELKETYQNSQQVVAEFFSDLKTVKIKEEYVNHSNNNLIFTFDHVFTPQSTQQDVFNIVGKGTISDIMEGYNGTIFAYGQTGSGKTFTMYGLDMFDEQLMGLVPRASRQIFQHIKSQDLEIEYQIRIQMVEIYKETLRDLLHDSPSQPPELKIKEDPKRGTYVEGLTEICIVSEEEMMAVLCTGETMRHVASTSLNQLSSRSHSICIVEIVQKFPNDSEKRGVLNLVDLAGSERVSKSHAQGQALEEAKKINFSLSMLGKVINCLTKNAPYIPYRDSKLTRLLKESLGGNNKTSLIVACSPHHLNIEETLSTLRFAQSAKFIQNKVKINMKTSPEQLQGIIEQLKQELRNCKEEIHRLRIISTGSNSSQGQTSQKQLEYKQMDSELDSNDLQIFKPSSDMDSQINQELEHPNLQEKKSIMNKEIDIKQTLHNRPHQSLLAKNYDLIETNNYRVQMLSLFSSELSNIPGNGTPNFISPVKNYELKLMQLINRNEDLEMKLKSKDKDIEALKNDKEELNGKVSSLEEKIINYKQKLLVMEKKVAEFESDKDFMLVKEVKQTHKLEDYQSQIDVLNQQVKCLERALEDTELNCQELLKEKQQIFSKQIKDFLNDTLRHKRVLISQALDNFINKPSHLRKSFISQLDIYADYVHQEKILAESEHLITPLNEKDLLEQNLYSLELVNAIEDTPPEITIYLLKQMLIESSLANHNLQRILAVNRWRQVMEFGKNKIKSKLCKVQENTIETLEQVLERTRKTHDKLRARVDKLENHLYDNRNYYGDIVLFTEGNNAGQPQSHLIPQKPHLQANQSIVSGALNPNQSQQNPKTRIVRTITNKTLGKVYNFIEKSPHSRASIGGNNQSILSQIYGQQKQTHLNYKQNSTPLRTGGMNSPAFYNFQSPIRRHNTFYCNGKVAQPQIFQYPSTNVNKEDNQQILKASQEQLNNDQMTFEDAIARFCGNSEQMEDKVAQKTQTPQQEQGIKFSREDLIKIEQFDTLQGLKDFLKEKLDKISLEKLQNSAAIHLNPLFVQYQNNAAYQNQSSQNLMQSEVENQQQINSHTTNNNLYAQSNDFYDNQDPSSQKGAPCSSSGNYHDHQRQEHVLTLASDYLITTNSVIGPNCLFSGNGQNGFLGGGGNYYQNDYLDRLQEKIVQLQEDVETQKCRAEEHKKAYYESKRQIEQMRDLMEEKESKYNIMLKNEICQWEMVVNKLKEMHEDELLKKQKEMEKLHEILAQWIESYQELEKSKGKAKNNDIEKLLKEMSNNFQMTKNLHQQKQQNKIQSQSTNSLSKHQIEPLNPIIFQTQQTMNPNLMNKDQNFDKKVINGDNSPVNQEESCFDFDQSIQNQILVDDSVEMGRLESFNALQTYGSNDIEIK